MSAFCQYIIDGPVKAKTVTPASGMILLNPIHTSMFFFSRNVRDSYGGGI